LVIGIIVKVSEIIEIWTNGETIDMPLSRLAQDHKSIKTLTDVWTFPNGNQAAGAVVQLLPSRSERNPVPFSSGADVQECGLKVEPLLIDGSGAALTERLDSAFQLNKGAKVFTVMNIGVRHVPLEKESILERLLTPVIVPDPLPDLPSLTTNAQVPVVAIVSEADVLDRIPEVLP
jgi:hypothetical protein